MGMEGGRRRCITEKAVDLPQRVYRFWLFATVSSNFPHVDVTQHVKQCLKLQREAKKNDTLWNVNGTTTITCKKHLKIMYLCTHATQHTPHGPHSVSSRLVSSRLFSSHIHLFRNLVEIILRQHVRWISSTMRTRHENANQHHGT